MTINTTLDSFLYANTVGFNPDYGKITPRPSGSLISREINQNMEKLISIGHSIVITEDSETTTIEYNASFVIKTENATLKLGTAFQGCQVTIVFAENGYIEYTKAEGNTKEKYKKNTIKKITYNGLYWIDTTPLQIPETNLTCDTAAEEEFKIVKIETILQQGKIPNNIELNIDFTNANLFGETTAATPTFPKLKITNAADEELGIYTICDSRGHYAGKGCWNSGDTMTFKIKGTKACITNSDVREITSDYTIYSDGRKEIHVLNSWKSEFIAAGDGKKVFSFKVPADFFNTSLAKRTFLLSATIFALGYTKPVLGFVDVFKSESKPYDGFVFNLSDSGFESVAVTMDGSYLNVSVTFSTYLGSSCRVSCHSLSNIPVV